MERKINKLTKFPIFSRKFRKHFPNECVERGSFRNRHIKYRNNRYHHRRKIGRRRIWRRLQVTQTKQQQQQQTTTNNNFTKKKDPKTKNQKKN